MKLLAFFLCTLSTLFANPIPQKIDLFLANPIYVFDIQFRPLCFQPISTNLYYAAESFPFPVASPDWTIFNITPHYHFGFDLGIGTVVHSRNIDITLNWEYFNASDSSSMTVALSSNRVGPFFDSGFDADSYKQANGQNNFYLNALNLDSGIFIHAGPFLQSRLFAGIKGAYIKQTLETTYASLNNVTSLTIDTPASFFGAGPEFGCNFTYRIIKNFSLVGQATSAFLVGEQKNSTTFTALSPSPNTQNITINHGGTQGIVPELDGRIGLAYLLSFWKHCILNIELGFEALLYINALYTIDISSEEYPLPVSPSTTGVFAKTFEKNSINFGLNGPYAMLTLGF